MSTLTQALVDVGFNVRRAEAIEAAITGALPDAGDVAFTPAGNIAATDVQAAIEELDTEKASAAALTAHIDDTTDAHDASAISFSNTASGLAATNAQAAIDEVDGRVDDLESAEPPVVATIAAGSIAGGTTNLDIPLGSHDMVEIDLISLEPSNDAATLSARFSQDSGSSYLSGASDYGWGFNGGGGIVRDNADSEIQVSDSVGNSTNERLTETVRIFRPSASGFAKTLTFYGGLVSETPNHSGVHGWGQLLLNTNAITHVRFLWSAGTFDTGHYAVRGYRFS